MSGLKRTKYNRRRPTLAQLVFFSVAFTASYNLMKTSLLTVGTFEYPRNGDDGGGPTPQRYAVANYVEGTDQIYGAFSIHRQLLKFGVIQQHDVNGTGARDISGSEGKAVHVAIVPNSIESKYRHVLASWLGEENVRIVDRGYILDRLRPEQGMWKGTFNKLWMHNLTEFDKVIVLDPDILVRSNIMHWFNYSTPCGIQAQDDLNWNSGAMVIRPDTELFEQMMATLPRIQRYKVGLEKDPLTNGYGDQDFQAAFFLTKENARGRCVMPTENAVLVSSLSNSVWFDYYNKYRPWVYQTVHFTTSKPWRGSTKTGHPFICKLFREWKESVVGIEEYYDRIPPLGDHYLASCPKETPPRINETETSPWINETTDDNG